jgi:hypothetical protein
LGSQARLQVRRYKFGTRLAASFVLLLLAPAKAAPLRSGDRAWIAACVKQRAASDLRGASARRYCACMQAIVDANEPFNTITALERAYPPAHGMCLTKTGQRRKAPL